MKTKFILAAAIVAAIISGCCNGTKTTFSGKIDTAADTLIINYSDAGTGSTRVADTLALVQSEFSMELPDTAAFYVYVSAKPAPGERTTEYSDGILVLPGEAVRVEGPISDLTISGSIIYSTLDSIEEYKSLTDAREQTYAEYRETSREDLAKIDSLRNALSATRDSLKSFQYNYIKNNPDSMISGYFVRGLDEEDVLEAEKLLSKEVRNGALKGFIDSYVGHSERMIRIEANWEKMQPGYQVPDFKLKNIDGEYMTLESFKGKYALIDFWGTWCGWCIKGIPDMKASYEKYSDKFEIVGIDCGDSEEKWKEGVAKYELPWTNLYNDNDSLTEEYGVQGYPCKILIDGEGKVVAAYLGEDPELYKKLDELFK